MYSINKMNKMWRLYCFSKYAFENSTQLPFDKPGRRHVEGRDSFVNYNRRSAATSTLDPPKADWKLNVGRSIFSRVKPYEVSNVVKSYLKKLLRATVFCCLLAMLLSSCSSMDLLDKPEPELAADDTQLPNKVAVLPFVNSTSNPEAAIVVRKMFYNFFGSLNYLDVEPSFVDEKLKKRDAYQKISSGIDVSARELGQILGVDAVIFGEVLSLGKVYAVLYSDTEASLRARMVSCYSGQTIWKLEYTAHVRAGEVPMSLTGLAAALVKTAISHKRANVMQAASKLCMQMVATVPNRMEITENPPRIEVMVHNGAGMLLPPGSQLKVVMVGDKNAVAGWSVLPLIKNLPMEEREPGVYYATYRVKPRDRLPYGRLLGSLRSDKGLKSQWVDILGPITIGKPSVLPPVVSRDVVLNAAKSPYLVEEALVVLPDAKLTIEPGTVIWFRQLGIVVKGELQISGTPQNPVRMAGMGLAGWKGILLDQSRTGNKLAYCTISNAEFGFKATRSTVKFQNCLFQDNKWGIVLDDTAAEIENSLIRTSEKTGISGRNSKLKVSGSTISENGAGGLLLEKSPARLEQNNISNNGDWAIKVVDDQQPVQAPNNWWGSADSDLNKLIIGPVEFQPVLEKPVPIQMLE